MISAKDFYEIFVSEGISFFTGVPDSLLKGLSAHLEAVTPAGMHIIAANEGSAVAVASGYHLATGEIPIVYMQNSGLGNAVNPLLSLADKSVYSLPMIILIGWRGRPGIPDEPQHAKQGLITPRILEALGVPWRQLNSDDHEIAKAARWSVETARNESCPVVLLIPEDVFAKEAIPIADWCLEGAEMSREYAISIITSHLVPETLVVSTTGMISRELYELRSLVGQSQSRDFLTVGSMGHASQIALGIANARPELQVCCLDGDGSVLMHMGGLATIGSNKKGNLFHIVLNNGVHDSVGGQPTAAQYVSLTDVAKACGYDTVGTPVVSERGLGEALKSLSQETGTRFLEVRVMPGSRSDLGRPSAPPAESKKIFTSTIREMR